MTRTMLAILGLALCCFSGLAEAQTSPLLATLTWTNADTTDQVQIDRGPSTTGPFAKYATVPAAQLTYQDFGVSAGQTYCYRVENFNSVGNGPSSNVACKTFPSVPTVAPVLQPIQ